MFGLWRCSDLSSWVATCSLHCGILLVDSSCDALESFGMSSFRHIRIFSRLSLCFLERGISPFGDFFVGFSFSVVIRGFADNLGVFRVNGPINPGFEFFKILVLPATHGCRADVEALFSTGGPCDHGCNLIIVSLVHPSTSSHQVPPHF